MTVFDLNMYFMHLVQDNMLNWFNYYVAQNRTFVDDLSEDKKRIFSMLYEDFGLPLKDIRFKLRD